MTHQLAAGCALAASALILTVQLLPPAISKIIMPVRSRNLGMAAPGAAQFVRGVIVPCRVIYGHLLSYRYPQPYSLSCRVVTSPRSAATHHWFICLIQINVPSTEFFNRPGRREAALIIDGDDLQ
jgi:hypothetical protein